MGRSVAEVQSKLEEAFRPAAPIEERRLFAGRVAQIEDIFEAVSEQGRHVVLYGERGVGKTSLANIIDDLLPEYFVLRAAADSASNYDTLWQKVLRRLTVPFPRRRIGFIENIEQLRLRLADLLPSSGDLTPDDVVAVFEALGHPTILIFDEFDRVTDPSTKTLLADTIKAFSDATMSVTLVVVGVARTVSELIGEHPSIERNLRQVRLPRMSTNELGEIIDKGLEVLGMTIDSAVKSKITHLSQGFPHYTHLLAKYAAREAIGRGDSNVLEIDLDVAIQIAVDDARESIRAAYHKATLASRRDTLFPKVLLAAALAPEDEFGTFRASDLLDPIERLTGRRLILPSFTYHLGKLCSEERGRILEKLGTPKRHRYRFTNPMMKPFILMKGYSEGEIDLSGWTS